MSRSSVIFSPQHCTKSCQHTFAIITLTGVIARQFHTCACLLSVTAAKNWFADDSDVRPPITAGVLLTLTTVIRINTPPPPPRPGHQHPMGWQLPGSGSRDPCVRSVAQAGEGWSRARSLARIQQHKLPSKLIFFCFDLITDGSFTQDILQLMQSLSMSNV